MSQRMTSTIAALALCFAAVGTPYAAVAAAPPSAPAPAAGNLIPGSTSWTSANDGWVHGFTGRCTTRDCAQLMQTHNGGITWKQRAAPPFHLPGRGDGVRIVSVKGEEDILYATTGRRLDVTYDGARTWSKVRLPDVEGKPEIGDIATTSHQVYAIIGQGAVDTGRTDLYTARVRHHRWNPVDGVTLEGNGVNVDGGWDVAAHQHHVAVALGRIFVSSAYWTSDSRTTFTPSTPPCTKDQVTALGAVTGDRVAALCSYNPGMGSEFKDLYASTDGAPFAEVGSAPSLGLSEDYVSLSPRDDVITAVSGASILYRSTASGWDTPLFLSDALPFVDLQFADEDHGFVVWGGPKSGMGKVYASDNAGVSWAPLPLS